MLNNILYDNLEKIIELINDSHINDKLFIKDINETNIELLIKLPIGYKEYDCSIFLNKETLNINSKFEIIIRELEKYKDKNNNLLGKFKDYLIKLKVSIENILNDNIKLINFLKEKNE